MFEREMPIAVNFLGEEGRKDPTSGDCGVTIAVAAERSGSDSTDN